MPTPTVGRVYLVGAGPGDPGLITLRGVQCLRRADLVLYDGLVNPLLLHHTRAHAERTCRTMGPDGARLNQAEINARLIEAARSGKTVVRLKGGDPFLFGRGGEEALALAEAGIPFEVVPGITAATAAAAYAGISLTHRELASAVAFVTGHEDLTKQQSSLDYGNLAAFPGTLVIYMGLHRLEGIVNALISAGKDGDVPAAVISRGTLPAQQTVTASLKDLPAAVHKANIKAPSLIVIGPCAAQRKAITWFEHRPLFGRSIGITRPSPQAGPVIERALELGAEPVLMPTIDIQEPISWNEVDAELNRLDQYDWLVFTSTNGVNAFLGRLWSIGGDVRRLSHLQIAAIGSSTAEALAEFHLRADVVPTSFRAESLADALQSQVAGQHVLWVRASRGRDVLPSRLNDAGAKVHEVVAYQNLDMDALPDGMIERIEGGELDWIALSSPSIARRLSELLPAQCRSRIGQTTRLVSISPVTSAAAAEVGLPISAEATVYTWDGIFDALIAAEGFVTSRGT